MTDIPYDHQDKKSAANQLTDAPAKRLRIDPADVPGAAEKTISGGISSTSTNPSSHSRSRPAQSSTDTVGEGTATGGSAAGGSAGSVNGGDVSSLAGGGGFSTGGTGTGGAGSIDTAPPTSSARISHAAKKGGEMFESKKEAAEKLVEKEKYLSEKGRV